MADADAPRSVWQGTFAVAGVELRCHVLSDGRRIVEEDSLAALLLAMAGDGMVDLGDAEAFARWQRGGDDGH